jgi:hypothetical protein
MSHNELENTRFAGMGAGYDDLKNIVTELRIANYSNNEGPLVNSEAFKYLENLAYAEDTKQEGDEQSDLTEQQPSGEPFHIEVDIYESGDYANLLVIPSAGAFIIVGNNEHLATMVKTCDDPACWEQIDGSLDDEVAEQMGAALDSYMQSF